MQVSKQPDARSAAIRNCNSCGAAVSRRFTKIFGDNDDQVYGCLECSPKRILHNGGAASRDR